MRKKPNVRISPTFRCAECGAQLIEVRRTATDFGHNLRCPRCDRDLLEKEGVCPEDGANPEQPILSDPSFLTDHDRALAMLGEEARTWISATLDNDEGYFTGKSDEQIRRAYRRWQTMTTLQSGKKMREKR